MTDYRTNKRNAIQNTPQMDNLILITHIIYGLHAFAIVTAILGTATVIGSFAASLPSILAVILNYAKISAVRRTWLESHFRWQIATFWYSLLWIVLLFALAITIIGIPFALIMWFFLTIWIIYRIGRGWWTLLKNRPLPMPPEYQYSE